jgi:hypothetical protein
MMSRARSRSLARLALGSSLAAVLAIAAIARDSTARRKMVFDEDFAPSIRQGFDGPAIGGRTAPAVEAPAHLASSPIAMIGDRALVIDADSGTLVLADAKGAVLDKLRIGNDSSQLVYDPAAHRAYVADRSGDRIVMVDVSDELIEAGSIPTPTEPYGLALTPDKHTLLVTTVADRTLVAYDPATGDERWSHALGREPRGIAISPDGQRAAVGYLSTGTIELIDLRASAADGRGRHVALEAPAVGNGFGAAQKVIHKRKRGAVVPGGVAAGTGRAFARNAFAVQFIGHGLTVAAHAVSTPVAATGFRENRGSYGGGFAPPISHRLAFLGGVEAQVGANIAVHQPNAMTWDARTDTLFVAGYGSEDVLVVEHASQADARLAGQFQIGLGKACGPQGLAVADDGSVMVWCGLARTMSKMTRKDGSFQFAAVGSALTKSRMSDLEHRGMELFRIANDGRLSTRGALACASCHPEVRADGLSWRIEGHELQTPLLSGKVLDTHPYKWDGGDKDLTTSLSSTMRRLGGGGLPEADTKALAAFLETVPAPRAPKRAAERIARGKALFSSGELGCMSCHNGALKTDREIHELTGTLTKVDTPALVGLAYSAPYFHDGSAATLEALLADNGLVHGMADTQDLTPEQVADLVAYLETL